MFRRLLLAALALAAVLALAPVARAQEAPPVVEPPPIPTADQPVDAGPPPDPVPVAPDPVPAPEPPPAPAPEPTPELQVPEAPNTQPADGHGQPAAKPTAEEGRNAGTHSAAPAPEFPGPALSVISEAAPVAAPPSAPDATTAPLGWDVYDDALFAETVDGEAAIGLGDGVPPATGGFAGLNTIASAAQRGKQHHAKPASRPEAMVPGGSSNGGTGTGNGASLGLFGAAGGAGAGMALMTLLGMACAWFLLAPDRLRAFLTSTATWRLSAYVPPIEHPG
jgi:hypothetical protein